MSSGLLYRKHLTSTGYTYETFPIDEIRRADGFFVTFDVKGEQDALIIFSSTATPGERTENVFEVVIGGHENTRSMIRTLASRGDENATYEEKDILSATEWRQFWIRVTPDGSSIEVGKKGSSAFMSLKDKPRLITYYGFAGWGKTVYWTVSPENDNLYCNALKTSGYNYQTFFPIGESDQGIYRVKFKVRTDRDAHILLSTSANPTEDSPVFEIVLGAGRNTYSVIRKEKQKDDGCTTKREQLLVSPDEWREFWIAINRQYVEIGRPDEEGILKRSCPGNISLNFYSFSSFNETTALWVFTGIKDKNFPY